jgi:hypothetical protein
MTDRESYEPPVPRRVSDERVEAQRAKWREEARRKRDQWPIRRKATHMAEAELKRLYPDDYEAFHVGAKNKGIPKPGIEAMAKLVYVHRYEAAELRARYRRELRDASTDTPTE